MSTAEINAYLEWRAEREGKMVDVSPEAYHRDCIIEEILNLLGVIRNADETDNILVFVDQMVDAHDELEPVEEN